MKPLELPYGVLPDGTPITQFVLTAGGLTACVITYGGILTDLIAPDRNGKGDNVVLGFDDLAGYLAGNPFFGATTGRVANRIAGAGFTLNGQEYRLAANDGLNSLHGGLRGFDKVVWDAEPLATEDGPAVKLRYVSPDGEEGFPGTLTTEITFTVTARAELRIDYRATTDGDTPINLTNHTYFNLTGDASGDVLQQEVWLKASQYTPVDSMLIPSGVISPVRNTPLDFTQSAAIGARIREIPEAIGGYDHNFVFDGQDGSLALVGTAFDAQSGRVMEMETTQPAVQFYTGNFLDGSVRGRGGAPYRKHQGFCLETQHFPDSVHHENFPSTILRPGEVYAQTTAYRFLTR